MTIQDYRQSAREHEDALDRLVTQHDNNPFIDRDRSESYLYMLDIIEDMELIYMKWAIAES